jgi:hypothetical protein
MPQRDDSLVAARVRWVRVTGICLFVLAFFLPAVRDKVPTGSIVTSADVYKGWFCAFVTLSNTFSRDIWSSSGFLAVLSGWINPLILIYLILLLRAGLVWPRRIVSMAIVAFMAATWVYFALAGMVPLIGHVLWIAGALMILAGEVVQTKAAQTETDSARTMQV